MLQGGGSVTQRFGENVQLSVKARYIDSDLTYFTHYTDSYSNPTNPYLDAVGHQIGLYSDGSFARLNVFSTDNNLQFKFSTGPARSEEHTSELQSLMRISYAVFCLKKKNQKTTQKKPRQQEK